MHAREWFAVSSHPRDGVEERRLHGFLKVFAPAILMALGAYACTVENATARTGSKQQGPLPHAICPAGVGVMPYDWRTPQAGCETIRATRDQIPEQYEIVRELLYRLQMQLPGAQPQSAGGFVEVTSLQNGALRPGDLLLRYRSAAKLIRRGAEAGGSEAGAANAIDAGSFAFYGQMVMAPAPDRANRRPLPILLDVSLVDVFELLVGQRQRMPTPYRAARFSMMGRSIYESPRSQAPWTQHVSYLRMTTPPSSSDLVGRCHVLAPDLAINFHQASPLTNLEHTAVSAIANAFHRHPEPEAMVLRLPAGQAAPLWTWNPRRNKPTRRTPSSTHDPSTQQPGRVSGGDTSNDTALSEESLGESGTTETTLFEETAASRPGRIQAGFWPTIDTSRGRDVEAVPAQATGKRWPYAKELLSTLLRTLRSHSTAHQSPQPTQGPTATSPATTPAFRLHAIDASDEAPEKLPRGALILHVLRADSPNAKLQYTLFFSARRAFQEHATPIATVLFYRSGIVTFRVKNHFVYALGNGQRFFWKAGYNTSNKPKTCRAGDPSWSELPRLVEKQAGHRVILIPRENDAAPTSLCQPVDE